MTKRKMRSNWRWPDFEDAKRERTIRMKAIKIALLETAEARREWAALPFDKIKHEERRYIIKLEQALQNAIEQVKLDIEDKECIQSLSKENK